jgi:hypothetical protein
MKKIIFTLALLVIATIGFSQSKKIVTHVVADTGKVFTDYINIDDQIFVKSTGIIYYSKVALQVPTTKNMAWMLASSARYGTPTFTTTSFNSKLDSNFVHTTGNESVYGIKTFTSPIVGSASLNELTSRKTNTTSVSPLLYPTWRAAKAYADSVGALLARIASPSFTGSMTGDANMRGSAAFSGVLTRVAVSIPGATSSDYYIVRQIATDSHTRPVAGDLLSCFAITDSLIVLRAVGTTSGETFTYFRIK